MTRTRIPVAGILLSLSVASCATHEPQPLEIATLWEDLQQQETPPLEPTLGPTEAVGWALKNNPELVGLRRQLEISESELLEAGQWPGLQLGWSAMDWLVNGTGDDVLTGFSFGIPLFAPDQRDALIAAAEASREVVHASLGEAEWRLTHRVLTCYVALSAASQRLQLLKAAEDISQARLGLLRSALDQGAATRLEVETAQLQRDHLASSRMEASHELEQARQALNHHLGLRPGLEYSVQPMQSLLGQWESLLPPDGHQLASDALQMRPDLQRLQAVYTRLEEELRLAISRQWPSIAIGTGIDLSIPVLSGFHRHRIRSAELRRELAGQELERAVRDLGHTAWILHSQVATARQRWDYHTTETQPCWERTMAAAEDSRNAGATTTFEKLTLYRQLIETEMLGVDCLAAHILAEAELAWFLGELDLPSLDR